MMRKEIIFDFEREKWNAYKFQEMYSNHANNRDFGGLRNDL